MRSLDCKISNQTLNKIFYNVKNILNATPFLIYDDKSNVLVDFYKPENFIFVSDGFLNLPFIVEEDTEDTDLNKNLKNDGIYLYCNNKNINSPFLILSQNWLLFLNGAVKQLNLTLLDTELIKNEIYSGFNIINPFIPCIFYTEYFCQLPIVWSEDALFQWYLKDCYNVIIEKFVNINPLFSCQIDNSTSIKFTEQSCSTKISSFHKDKKFYQFNILLPITGKHHHKLKPVPIFRLEKVKMLDLYTENNISPESISNKSLSKSPIKSSSSPPLTKLEEYEIRRKKNLTNKNNTNIQDIPFNESEDPLNNEINFMLVSNIHLNAMYIPHSDEIINFTTEAYKDVARSFKATMIAQLEHMRDQCLENDSFNILNIKDHLSKKVKDTGKDVVKQAIPPTIQLFKPLIFYPSHGEINLPITVLHTEFNTFQTQKQFRKSIADSFFVPPVRPLFVPNRTVDVSTIEESLNHKTDNDLVAWRNPKFFLTNHMINPHMYIKYFPELATPSPAKKSKNLVHGKKGANKLLSQDDSTSFDDSNAITPDVRVVAGMYAYYHYGQNGIKDFGWGCAYRSLQTIASWLIIQGYTQALPVKSENQRFIVRPPTLKEIQTILYEIGDKKKDFVGSSQWIGSNEISYVLQHIYEIDSKILHLHSGTEIKEYVNALSLHFEIHGSPVMIGGGALAHTILGVKTDAETGETLYLILDPHYTGPDEVEPILHQKGCYWETSKLWDTKQFYNICLPQRPIVY